MKTPQIFFTILSFVLVSWAQAQSLYVPPYCEGNVSDLLVRNKSAQAATYWLGWTQGASTDEQAIEIEGAAKTAHALNEISATSNFKIFQSSQSNLSFSVRCQNSEMNLPLSNRVSPIQVFELTGAHLRLHLANLSWEENHVRLEWLSASGTLVKSQDLILAAKSKDDLTLANPIEAKTLKVNGAFRLMASTATALASQFGKKILRLPASQNGAYFEMGLRNNARAPRFVVFIEDQALLAQARELLKNPKIEKIVFGRIARGSGGYNVDTQEADKSPWSWHYETVTNIADFGSTACNGNPEMLEDHLNGWLENNAYACFWSYRLLREMKPNEKF